MTALNVVDNAASSRDGHHSKQGYLALENVEDFAACCFCEDVCRVENELEANLDGQMICQRCAKDAASRTSPEPSPEPLVPSAAAPSESKPSKKGSNKMPKTQKAEN